ncbi:MULTISPECIES: hypothetical protein [unclassified Bradyrhizobium]|uniref:hypothetical protein n=1 Tax=unclassified Bradyrhizobium TaxID=2631580 RepID=UPI00247AEF65|nr:MULTISPECIES: hypothetical protein [unclassified Bradyrhizobium]WGR72790.1 hypothetical protein MTX24_07750 [Bradyrhizobium sp. ISRA426]WGR77625.1 hypothetical protein MTX21_32705 [Bradyrhizobium sp. ISRA430]WGR88030.1 hypothetical protein MTX25_07755 [Bradyrhizobium sp. ISRA432]
MDRYNAINPAYKDSAASDTTVEQPKEPQAVFEQHLREVRQLGPVYSHSGLYDITEEDDRLIRAASGAALDRGPPPKAITIEIYDRRLRKLADLLKQSGHSIAELDDDTLLERSKKLLPEDKVIFSALSMVSRYREPSDTAPPPTTHYRPSKEDANLIREATEAGFGRAMDAKTAGNYASSLRKLATALRPLSIAKLSHKALLGHADALFPKDKKLIYALNRLNDYRRLAGRDNSPTYGSASRQSMQPAADLPVQLLERDEPLGNADGSLPTGGFNAQQFWEAMGLTARSPAQLVAQDMLFDAVHQNDVPPPASFDAPVLWQGMRAAAPSPLQSFAQEALFDAADREGLAAASFDELLLWPTTSSVTRSQVQSVAQEELLDAADREGLPPVNVPVLWPSMSSAAYSPVQDVAREQLLGAGDREGLPTTSHDAPVRWPTAGSVTHSHVQSVAQQELFDAADRGRFAPAFGLEASKLWTAMEATTHSAGGADPFDAVIWQPSSRPQGLASEKDFGRMMNQDAETAGENFDASLAVTEDFSHGTQPAPDMMRSKLSRWGQMPDAAKWVKTYDIHGERYTGVLGPRGRSDLQLIHLRSPAVGDTFDVSFAVPNDFSHRTQLAPDMMLSELGKWDFLPNAECPFINYEIGGERYTAVLGPRGSNDVQLIHHPRFASRSDAALVTPTAPPHTYGLASGFDRPSWFELQAPNLQLPPAAPVSGHHPLPQVPELGELFGHDWRHGPQEASPLVIDMLQNLGLLPSQGVPMTCFLIHGEPYTAESLPGGRVLLFHRPQFG